MSLTIDNIVQSIDVINDKDAKENFELAELTQAINKLELSFNCSVAEAPKELFQANDELSELVNQIKIENGDLQNLLILRKSLDKLDEMKIKYNIFFNDELVKDFEQVEITSREMEARLTIRLEMVNFSVKYKENINHFDKFDYLYAFLSQISEVLEKYNVFVPKDLLERIKSFAESVVSIFTRSENEKPEVKLFFKNIRNMAKGVLHVVNNCVVKQKMRLKKQEDNTWQLVIGEMSYDELLKESQKRIHLLDTLEPKTEDELQNQLGTLKIIEEKFNARY